VVAVLAALDIPLQLRSHLEGARRVGATAGEIRSVLEAVRRR
jgi:alkylhydroperoxidase/carboxymuconolactone decarboxylase family protein YurZ